MKKFIFLILVLISGFAFAQTQTDEYFQKSRDNNTESNAEFPGGIKALRTRFSDDFRFRKVVGSGPIRSELTFVVEINGTISDVKAVGENESFNKEVIISFNKIKDIWIPAKKNGVKVRSRYRLPLTMDFK